MFGKDFMWGSATASAQIEGGWNEGGKSLSIWDSGTTYKHSILTKEGHHSLDTCRHFTYFKEDVALMKKIGLKAYRFSISWSRLIPSGTGEVSKAGAKFYSDLVNELLSQGIEPLVTLFHWDLPQCLQDKGGWQNPDSAKWFEHYAKVVGALLCDRVKYFITINEPEVFIVLGYAGGGHAPFYKLPPEEIVKISYNVMKASGLATIELRKQAKNKIYIFQSHALTAKMPYSNSVEDIAAAKKMMFEKDNAECSFVESILNKDYLKQRMDFLGHPTTQSELDVICIRPDFIGYNTYTGRYYKADENGEPQEVPYTVNTDYSAMDWAVMPECLYWNSKMLYERYKLPVIITENGVAISEWENKNGQVNDESRIEYMRKHLLQIDKAINEGVDVRGYFYWSLFDNFEWALGFSKRFGLIRVNFETFARTLKSSALWYQDVIKSGGTNLY